MNRPIRRPRRACGITPRLRTLGPLLLVVAQPLQAQAPTRLAVGQTVQGTFEGPDTHTFLVILDQGRTACGEVDQRTVDVVVTVHSPTGTQIARYDDTGRQWEPFCVEAEEAGGYRVDLSSFNAHSGDYSVRLDRVEKLSTTREGRLEQWMDHIDRTDRPGGAVAVVRGGDIVYARAYGLADVTHGIPFSLSTVANIGSVSKQFTGFAIALLASEGTLSLDDDVRRFLPEVPDFGEPVTLRHLLHHTSGIRDVTWTLPMRGLEWADVTREGILREVGRQQALDHPPGAEHRYNNTGYVLLAEVIARATGVPFEEWMRRRIFQPLGMGHATVQTVPGQVIPHRAEGAVRVSAGAEDVFREPPTGHAWFGATGIYASVLDLVTWMQNLRDPRIGGPEVIATLTERGILISGDTLDYGFGIQVTQEDGVLTYTHGGGDGAFRTRLAYYPGIDAGLAVFGAPAFLSVPERATEAFLEPLMPARPDAAEDPVQEEEATAIDLSEELLAECSGRFGVDRTAVNFTLTADHGRLQWEAEHAEGFLPARATFVPVSDSSFVYEELGIRLTLRRGETGTIDEGTLDAYGSSLHLRRIAPYSPSAEELSVYVGRYFSPELELIYTITAKGGGLVVGHHRLGEVELLPREPDRFAASRWPLDEVRFERNDAGVVTGLVARGVRFEKLGR